jgi:aminoglycoside 6'-N-acetyltransferase I
MPEVRPVTPADAAAWSGMRLALWPDEDGAELTDEVHRFFAGSLREPIQVLVAEDASGILGFAELSIRPYAEGCTTDRVAYLEGWYVIPAARRRGVGAALVGGAEDWGRSQGCTEFGSDALLDNEVSRAAHRALGFEEIVQIRCFLKPLR